MLVMNRQIDMRREDQRRFRLPDSVSAEEGYRLGVEFKSMIDQMSMDKAIDVMCERFPTFVPPMRVRGLELDNHESRIMKLKAIQRACGEADAQA